MHMRLIGVDVGGTFTDIVFHDTGDGTIRIHKVPTTPDNPALGVLGGITELCDRFGVDRASIDQPGDRKAVRVGLSPGEPLGHRG